MTDRTCSVDGCTKPHYCLGMCRPHYKRRKLEHTDSCAISGCGTVAYARGWCGRHYNRWRAHGDPEWQPPPPKGTCSIDGCDRRHEAHGLCSMHSRRFAKHGDPLVASKPTDDVARFRSKVDLRGDGECWPWTGGKSFGFGGRNVQPREYAYVTFVGPIPPGYHMEHIAEAGCAGGTCVNWLRHLRVAAITCKWCGAEFTDSRTGRHLRPCYCSDECRRLGGNRRRLEGRHRFGGCGIEGCTNWRRSGSAEWCEMHYQRWWMHGDVLWQPRVRHGNGICHHCGDPTGTRKQLFCSNLCRRRDRLGIPGRERDCVVCGATLREDARPDALFCSVPIGEPSAGRPSTNGHRHRHRSWCQVMWERARLYGLTVTQLREMLEGCTGCAICGRQTKDLHVDHDHATGRVRALLCAQCNIGLGMFKENPDSLRSAIAYLGRFSDVVEDKPAPVATA